MSDEEIPAVCALCDHDPACGLAVVDGRRLCDTPGEHSCYLRWVAGDRIYSPIEELVVLGEIVEG